MRALVALIALTVTVTVTAPAVADDLVVDDFTVGPLRLNLINRVEFTEIRQQQNVSPIVRGGRTWHRVWSATREPDQSAVLEVDPSDGVFSIDTEGDPFTYFALSYELIERDEFNRVGPFDAAAAGVDRVRLRFSDGLTRIFHSLSITSVSDGVEASASKSFGAFATIQGGVLELPLTEFSRSDNFTLDSLTGLTFSASRYQGDFDLDAIELAGPPVEGDLNRDGILDLGDRDYLQANYLGLRDNVAFSGAPLLTYHTADVNGDGQVNAVDYTAWRDVFDSTPFDGIGVPEPAGATLVLLAGAGVSRRRRR